MSLQFNDPIVRRFRIVRSDGRIYLKISFKLVYDLNNEPFGGILKFESVAEYDPESPDYRIAEM